MASYKLNIARIQGCPSASELGELIDAYGLPDSEEFGVLNSNASGESVFATIVRKTQQAVQKLDPETNEVLSAPVEKVNVYPIGVRPGNEILEVYAGAGSSIEQVGLFFASCLALPTVTEPIEVEIPSALEKLEAETARFQLKSIRVSDYAHNAYMAGAYTPKFLDSQHGKDFLEEHIDYVTTASVAFQGPTGRVTVSLNGTSCFGFSCKEDDQPVVQSILRKLL